MFNGFGNYGNFQYPVYGQQQQQQQQMQPQYNPQPSGNYYYVNGVEGAKAFMVQPNTAVVLFDSDSNNRFYVKMANQNGQATLKTYEYTEPTPQIETRTAEPTEKVQFVKAEEFEAFKGNFEEFKTKVINYIKKNKEDK